MSGARGMAFETVIHPATDAGAAGPIHADAWGTWPTMAVGPRAAVTPFAVSFDEMLDRLGRLEGVSTEPDGSVVGVDTSGAREWQFDAQLADLGGLLLTMEVKGSCPPSVFDAVLGCCGWPQAAVMMQLPRSGIFLAEEVFRLHAAARWVAGDGRVLRPS